MVQVRECGSGVFNTGISRCPLAPERVKAIILAERGVSLPAEFTLENLEMAMHADRPNRLFGVKNIVEFAPSGGDVQTSVTGWGPSEVTGYAAYTAAWTLGKYDAGFRANVMRMKNVAMQAWYVDSDNIIWGEEGADDICKGIDLAGVYISGQDQKASGTNASNVLNLMYDDVEKSWMHPQQIKADFDVLSAITGLRFVEVVKKEDATDEYYVRDRYDKLNLGSYFSGSLDKIACWNGATAVAYAAESQTFKITVAGAVTPTLASASVLQTNGVIGIEQWIA